MIQIFGKRKLNVLIIGNKGMLGSYLEKSYRELSLCKDSIFGHVVGADSEQIDITSKRSIEELLERKSYVGKNFSSKSCDDWSENVKFDCVINCAAITDTTACEGKLEDLSFKVNALGVKNLAEACAKRDIHLVHVSTDYVFSEKGMYDNDLEIEEFPVNKYGMHKLLGEKYLQLEYAAQKCKKWTILRTSWLFGPHYPKTFIHKFLLNCYKAARDEENACPITVNVTDDNYGKPTSCKMLGEMISATLKSKIYGVFDGQYLGRHLTRAEFAKEILEFWKSNFDENEVCPIQNVSVNKISSDSLNLPIQHPKKLINSLAGGNLQSTFDKRELKSHKRYVQAIRNINIDYMYEDLASFLSKNLGSNFSEIEAWLKKSLQESTQSNNTK